MILTQVSGCITYLKNFKLAMDTHGLTWTNTFIHARLGMKKTPDTFGITIYNQETAVELPEVFIGSNYGL